MQKEKLNFVVAFYVLRKTRKQAFSRRSRAKTGKEMYKKSMMHVQTCCFAHLTYRFFLTFLLPSASLDLKVLSVDRYETTLKHGCVADTPRAEALRSS